MSDQSKKDTDSSARKTNDSNSADPAVKREKPKSGRGTSRDIREDRGIRQHKLGKHKN